MADTTSDASLEGCRPPGAPPGWRRRHFFLDPATARRGPPRAPRADQARRRRGEDRPSAREGKADRARAPRAADRRGHVRGARHPRPPALLPARDGRRRGARRRRHHRLRQGRRPAGRGVRLRLHGDGRLDGHDRRAEGHAPARARADEADPVHLAARLRRRAHPGGRRLAVRGLGLPVPRGGRDERRDPAGRGPDGARAPPAPPTSPASPTSCRWSRAAARWRSPVRTSCAPRSARTSRRRNSAARACTAASRAWGTWRSPTTRSASSAIKEYLSYMPQNCEAPAPVRPVVRSDRPRRRGAARRAAGVQPQAVRHVRGDPPHRRRRRLVRHEGRSGRRRSSPASRASAGARPGSSPTSPSSSAASSTTTPPTRPRGS